jgi:hypothetical protein
LFVRTTEIPLTLLLLQEEQGPSTRPKDTHQGHDSVPPRDHKRRLDPRGLDLCLPVLYGRLQTTRQARGPPLATSQTPFLMYLHFQAAVAGGGGNTGHRQGDLLRRGQLNNPVRGLTDTDRRTVEIRTAVKYHVYSNLASN